MYKAASEKDMLLTMTKGTGQSLDTTTSSPSETYDNCAHVQERRGGGYKKLQATQPHLISWGNHRANPPKAMSKHMKDKKVTGETIKDAPSCFLYSGQRRTSTYW